MKMRPLVFLLLLLFVQACESVPSCSEAMDHYYDVGCTFVELETGQPWDEGQAAAACRDSLTTIPEDCDDLYDDWLVCLGDVEDGDTDAQCTSCDREHEDWIRCAT